MTHHDLFRQKTSVSNTPPMRPLPAFACLCLAARRVMSGQPRQISSRAEVLKSWKKRKLST